MNVREKLMMVQSRLKAPKDQNNTFGNYKYRSCESILEALKPLLTELKTLLVISDEVVFVETRFYVIATATFTDIEKDTEKITVTAWARENEAQKANNLKVTIGALKFLTELSPKLSDAGFEA